MLLKVRREKRKERGRNGGAGGDGGGPAADRETRQRLKQLASRRDELAATVERLETRVHEINEVFCDPTYFDRTPHEAVRKLEGEQKKLNGQIGELMGEWERLEEEVEGLEAEVGAAAKA